MSRVIALVMGVMLLFGGVAACGSSASSSQAAPPASPTASSSGSQTAAAASCASAGTRKIPKTRLLADLALTYGAFHRYLYKPFKAGAFHKGAEGRTKAIIKAVVASAAIVKLLSNAEKNAEADPTLCKYVPTIGNIRDSLTSLAGKIRGGDATAGDADSTSSLFDQLKNQTGFTAPSASSLPGLG